MTTVLHQMLAAYEKQMAFDRKTILKQIMQEMVLCGLSRGGFFKKAAFYGGTALRLFHQLDRFSEDLDFSLIAKDTNFDLSRYFSALEKEVESFGLRVEISEKVKMSKTQIQSAFVKAGTEEHSLLFYGNGVSDIHPKEKTKIKFEVDTDPPDFATFNHEYRLLPSPYELVLYDLPSLFAGKVHAVLCRSWTHRVKGRDLYDYIFFLAKNIPLNLPHLQSRLIQSGVLSDDDPFDKADLIELLKERFKTMNYRQAKEDVIPFVRDQDSLTLWNEEFFRKITNNLTVQ